MEYSPVAADPGPEGNGDPWVWELAGDVHPVEAALLPDLAAGVAELTPQSGDLFCTADLGPRWMLFTRRATT